MLSPLSLSDPPSRARSEELHMQIEAPSGAHIGHERGRRQREDVTCVENLLCPMLAMTITIEFHPHS